MEDLSIVLGTGARGILIKGLPLVAPFLFVGDVVMGASIRVAQQLERGSDLAELDCISGGQVIWVIPFGQKSIDPLDGFRVGDRVDLENLVVVHELALVHNDGPLVTASVLISPQGLQAGCHQRLWSPEADRLVRVQSSPRSCCEHDLFVAVHSYHFGGASIIREETRDCGRGAVNVS